MKKTKIAIRDGSRNFGKGAVSVRGEGPNRAPKARAPAGELPRKFWKIRCDFLQSGIYFWDQNGVGYNSKWGLCRTKNSSGHDFDSHTHTSKNSSDFGHYKIQIQFQKYFSDIVYYVKNKIDFAKNRGPGPPWIRPWLSRSKSNVINFQPLLAFTIGSTKFDIFLASYINFRSVLFEIFRGQTDAHRDSQSSAAKNNTCSQHNDVIIMLQSTACQRLTAVYSDFNAWHANVPSWCSLPEVVSKWRQSLTGEFGGWAHL